jgi:hypothetical protein
VEVSTTHKKYPEAIQAVWSLAFNAFPMIDKLAAKVVWSINASKSVVEQARKI